MIDPEHLSQIIQRLAINYGRAFEDEQAVFLVFDTWLAQLGHLLPDDLDAAAAAMLADANVTRFPTVAEMRSRVIAASQARHRAAAVNLDGRGTVSCLRCMDSGFLDAGTDEEHYWFVRKCPEGCLPPPAHRSQFRRIAGRSGPHHQPALSSVSAETLQAAVRDTKRMLGEHDDPLTPF